MVLLAVSIWNLSGQIENNGDNIGFALGGILGAVILLIREWRKEIKSNSAEKEESEP